MKTLLLLLILKKFLLIFIILNMHRNMIRFIAKFIIIRELIRSKKESEEEYNEDLEHLQTHGPLLAKDIENDLKKISHDYYISYLTVCLLTYALSLYLLYYYLLLEDLITYYFPYKESSILIMLQRRPVTMNLITSNRISMMRRNYLNNNFDRDHKFPIYPLKQWCYYRVEIEETEWLTWNVLSTCIDEFYENVLNTLTENQKLQVTIKIKYIENIDTLEEVVNYKSLTGLMSIENNLSNKSRFRNTVRSILDLKSNYYSSTNTDKVIFIFRILEKDPADNHILPILDTRYKIEEKKREEKYRFEGLNLPLPSTMDYQQFGEILTPQSDYLLIKGDRGYTFKITHQSDCNIIEILVDNKIPVLIIRDYPLSANDPSTFKREVNNDIYYFIRGELVVKKQMRKASLIKPLITNKRLVKNRAITLDVETTYDEIVDERTGKKTKLLKVYLISIYDGKKATSFYIDDFKDEFDLIHNAISFLINGPYNNKNIYVHNLARFDSVFLVKYLCTSKDCEIGEPLVKDGRFIQIPIRVGDEFTLNFVDSLQILPQSLKSLAKQFNVEEKGLFPVLMPKPEKDDPAIFPDYKFFKDVSLEEYNLFKSEFKGEWKFREEAIKYCEQDCVTLYQVINKFNELIFERFKKNIWSYPTLPSLALAIYRSNYLKGFKIPKIIGITANEIKSGFTGGSTDMFIPYSNKPIYVYDVNSLYPYVMANMDMPVGKIKNFQGDITKTDPEAFGFFDVEIKAPKDLKIPILQTHIKTDGGTRTISPLGTWRGVYFSEEIKNARKFGYEFEILRGYTFDRAKIFEGYINNLYEIKQNSFKSDAMYLISKLLMNSLFGRFSLDYNLAITRIISTTLFDEISLGKKTAPQKKRSFKKANKEETEDGQIFFNTQLVTEFITLGENKTMATIENLVNLESDEDVEHFFGKGNVSIAISAAIAAYARIHMTQFKKPDSDYTLYYTDTDSIFIDKPLDPSFIGPELGKMKLEYIFEESIFLASKVYGGHIQGEDKDICKVKGFKNKVAVSKLKSLLSKNEKITLSHDKWFRNFEAGNITVQEQPYILRVTDNKRKLIFDENNILVKTEPYIINVKKEITNK